MARYPKKGSGVGNKEGSVRPNFFKFVTPKDIEDYMKWVLKNYKKNPKLAMWFGDHLFGKAVQPIGNDGDKPLKLSFDSAFNGSTPETT